MAITVFVDWVATGVILSVCALALAVSALVSIARNDNLLGSAKAMWIVAILLFPIFGSVVYFGVRADW